MFLVEGLIQNLLNISILRNSSYDIIFNQISHKDISKKEGDVLFNGTRRNKIYEIKLYNLEAQEVRFLIPGNEEQ